MDEYWFEQGIDGTVRDFDFTKKAMRDMYSVITSDDFENMDSEVIFKYLCQGMETVAFKDYLRRYLYEKAGIQEKYRDVEDAVYMDIIRESFRENCAPQSFTPTTKKWTATIRGWLQKDCVKRQTVFLLGFGLRMRAEDVSVFLVKVLREQDFNFYDKNEVIYWYCYKNQLSYLKAKELQEKSEEFPSLKNGDDSEKNTEFSSGVKERLTDEQQLLTYLAWLKATGIYDNNQSRAKRSFLSLFGKAQEIIAGIYNTDEEEKKSGKIWTAEQITPGDVEKVICSGVPLDSRGNLWKMSFSLFKDRFQQCRLSRQRIDALLKNKIPVERFDLITLNFFQYSQMEDLYPDQRCEDFVKSTNIILKGCGMNEIYPVHPYESFVLLCLLTECPLAVYSEIWELSYQQEE